MRKLVLVWRWLKDGVQSERDEARSRKKITHRSEHTIEDLGSNPHVFPTRQYEQVVQDLHASVAAGEVAA